MKAKRSNAEAASVWKIYLHAYIFRTYIHTYIARLPLTSMDLVRALLLPHKSSVRYSKCC